MKNKIIFVDKLIMNLILLMALFKIFLKKILEEKHYDILISIFKINKNKIMFLVIQIFKIHYRVI